MREVATTLAMMLLSISEQTPANNLFLKCNMEKGTWEITAHDNDELNRNLEYCPFREQEEILNICEQGERYFKIVTHSSQDKIFGNDEVYGISILTRGDHPYYRNLDEICLRDNIKLEKFSGRRCNEYINKNEISLYNYYETLNSDYNEYYGADRHHEFVKINRENGFIKIRVSIDTLKDVKFKNDGSQIYSSGELISSISAEQVGECELSADMEKRPTKF